MLVHYIPSMSTFGTEPLYEAEEEKSNGGGERRHYCVLRSVLYGVGALAVG